MNGDKKPAYVPSDTAATIKAYERRVTIAKAIETSLSDLARRLDALEAREPAKPSVIARSNGRAA